MCGNGDGTHSRSASPMGNAEGFVQIQVAGIDAKFSRPGDADQGIKIGAIHVNLTSGRVYLLTEFADS